MMLARIAWRNLWRQGRRSLITAAAMAFGVAMCMATAVISDGMYAQAFSALVLSDLGHVQVHAEAYPGQRSLYDTVPDGARRLAQLRGMDEVVAAAPRANGYALMASETGSTGGQLRGVEPAAEAQVTVVAQKIIRGRCLSDEPRGEILLGAGLAKTLMADVGSEIVVLTQATDGSMGNALLTVAGVFQSGSAALDRRGAFVHLADLQALLVLGDGIHEIALVGEPHADVTRLAERAEAVVGGGGVLVRSWKAIDPSAAQVIASQDGLLGMLLVVVFAVAGLGILNTMLMAVFERTHELGLMNALGMTPREVMGQILWETVFLAAMASVVGVVLGAGLDAYLVLHGWDLSSYTDGISSFGVGFDPLFKGDFRADRVALIVLGLFGISVLAALWPARRAARLDPVVAMREEA